MTIPITPRMSDVRACTAGITNLVKAMKEKLAKKRREGRGGWHRANDCDPGCLADMLLDHLARGDIVDVANFAMMLYNRGDGGRALIGTWAKRVKSWKQTAHALPDRLPGDLTLRDLQTRLPWTVH